MNGFAIESQFCEVYLEDHDFEMKRRGDEDMANAIGDWW